MIKIAIIQFPGSNCETESLRAVRNVGMEAEEFLWNRNPQDLKNLDGYFIVGGFSYEDRSRSGIIAALDPLIPYLRAEAAKGKPILGVCNGAQILVETGLVPGLKNYAVGMALAENKRMQNAQVLGTGYYNAWVHMKLSAPTARTAFTNCLKENEILEVPIAHGEGRFIIPSDLLEELKQNQQTTFRYCAPDGGMSEHFPTNPNGAMFNLAAVSNPEGNVLAMMPHPERRPDMGREIFESMRDYIENQKNSGVAPSPYRRAPSNDWGGEVRRGVPSVTTSAPKSTANHPQPLLRKEGGLLYIPPPLIITDYHLPDNTFTITTELIITDNEAKTVETTLQQLGLPVTVERLTHWEIKTEPTTDQSVTRATLLASGELFNSNKERLVDFDQTNTGLTVCLLVRYREDLTGQQKKEFLEQRFALKNVTAIKKGSIWKITPRHGTIPDLRGEILATNVLFNQFSQECFICEDGKVS